MSVTPSSGPRRFPRLVESGEGSDLKGKSPPVVGLGGLPAASDHFKRRSSARPAGLFNSLASIVPSLSGSAFLKRTST